MSCLACNCAVLWLPGCGRIVLRLASRIPKQSVLAGARDSIYHDPKQTTAAIVTCGGLCPGLNDVVAVSLAA